MTRHCLSPEAISRIPHTAQTAFRSYRQSHPSLRSRQEIIAKALNILEKKQDELAKELTEQMGRPIAYTAKEITTAVKRGEYLNKIASEILEKDTLGEEEEGFRRYVRREPVGVVLVIFAWNVCFYSRAFQIIFLPDSIELVSLPYPCQFSYPSPPGR